FQVMLSLQNAVKEVQRLPGLGVEPEDPGYEGAKFDLAFEAQEADDGTLAIVVDYALDVQASLGGVGLAPHTEASLPTPAVKDLRKITMAASGDLASMGPGGDGGGTSGGGSGGMFGGGQGSFTLGVEWGASDTVKLDVSIQSGMLQMSFASYCTPRGTVMTFGGKSVRERPEAGANPCGDMDPARGLGGLSGGSPGADSPVPFDLVAPPGMDVKVSGDEVTATWVQGANTTTLHMEKRSGDWRITSIEETNGKATLTMTLDYGARQSIAVPTDAQLEPAKIDAKTGFVDGGSAGTYSWQAMTSRQRPALSDFEVRVFRPDSYAGSSADSASSTPPVATFRMDGAAGERSGNFTFTYVDADRDGKVTAGDSFTLASPGWKSGWTYDVVVYDVPGHGAVNTSHLTPPVGLALLVVALVGAALVRRR
ncbi:MAG: hypothetical protein ABR562_05790, partial [Thermoplasmatota archaeon]